MKKRPVWLSFLTPVVILIALAFLAFAALKQFQSGTDGRGTPLYAKGSVVKNLEFKTLEGKSFFLEEQLMPKGKIKVVLLNFWASWCEACIIEMPSINRLRERFQNQGFEVFGVNLDENPEAVVPASVRKLQMLFPIFVDPEAALADQFGVRAIPYTAILNQDRKILLTHAGDRDWFSAEMVQQVERWLAP